MKLLIRLYPREWRERYGAEFEALLSHERLGLAVILDILISALGAHATAFADDSRLTLAELGRSTSRLRAINKFTAAFSLLSAVLGSSSRHWSLESCAILLATLAVVGLALLSKIHGPSGSQAQRALGAIGVPVVVLHLNSWPPFSGGPSPVLLAFLVVVEEGGWPAPWSRNFIEPLCLMLGVLMLGAGAVSAIPAVPAILLGGVWLLSAARLRRTRLQASLPSPSRLVS